jgi:hypothetical protein
MINKYSIIQYCPNPVSGEVINIGIVVFNEQEITTEFINNWTRVKHFANNDITFLKEFCKEFDEHASMMQSLPNFSQKGMVYPSIFEKISSYWNNSIQITQPRSSTKPQKLLMDLIKTQFLNDIVITINRNYRDRKSAAKIAKDLVKEKLINRLGVEEVNHYFHTNRVLDGKFNSHTFDTVVANGVPYLAVQAISFELPEARDLEKDVNALAFQIYDVKACNKKLPIGILALPPVKSSSQKSVQTYNSAMRAFVGMQAKVFGAEDAPAWIDKIIDERLPSV